MRVRNIQKKGMSYSFFRRSFSTMLLLIAFLVNFQEILAQKAIDTLNFATDGHVNTAVISGDALYIGGYFNYIGTKTGSVAFFNNGSVLPDEKKPLFGSMVNNGFSTEEVLCVISDEEGGWFVGGSFTKVDNLEHLKLAHVLPDNTLDHAFDLPFNSGRIYALKKDGEFLYVGGEFSFVDNSAVTHRNILRINLNTKEIDSNWNPPVSNSSSVDRIEISSDKVILAGAIGKVDNVSQDAMVVLNKATGARISLPTVAAVSAMHLMGDTLIIAEPNLYWGSDHNGAGYISKHLAVLDETNDIPQFSAPDGFFYRSVSDNNGGWYVIGNYYAFDGTGVYHLDKDLNPIATFTPPKISSFLENSVLFLNGNDLYISFSQYVSLDAGDGSVIKYLCKLDATTGALDKSFKPNPHGNVSTMVLNDGLLYIGGIFDSIGSQARSSLGAIDAITGIVDSWNPEINLDNFNAGYTGGTRSISDLKVLNDTLLVAGKYQIPTENRSGTREGIYGLSRFNLNTGEVDTSFHISTSYYDNTKITSMAIQDNKLFVVGSFELNKLTSPVKNMGVVDLKTGTIQTVNSDLTFTANGTAKTPEILLKNNILYIWAMGIKKVSTGETRSYFVSLNATDGTLTSWNPNPENIVYSFSFSSDKMLLSGVFYFFKSYSGGLVGINIQNGEYIHFPSSYTITSIVSSDKYIFMGGDITRYNDSVVNGLFRLKRSDLSYTRFDHQITKDNSRAGFGMLALGSEGLYVVGIYYKRFSLVGGVPRQNICLLDPETAALKTWNPPQFNGNVNRVFAHGSSVVFSGDFGLMPTSKRLSLAKIDLNTGKIADWNANLNSSGYVTVNKLLISGDTLYVGGSSIATVNGQNSGNLFALNASTGTLLEGFVPPMPDGSVTMLSKQGGFLYAGGKFEKVADSSRLYLAKFDITNGVLDKWDAKLNIYYYNLYDILADESAVYVVGYNLGIANSTTRGKMLRFDAATAELQKIYQSTSTLVTIAQNESKQIAVGGSNNSVTKGFFILNNSSDSLISPPNLAQEFYYGVNRIKAIGDVFLVAGNRLKEFGTTTYKPGMYVYNPLMDSVTSFFSTPVISGDINTFAANENQMIFGGEFGGMNNSLKNADIAFMKTPNLYLKPGVMSWSPQTANTIDPFAISIFGNGFTTQTTVSLKLSDKTVLPDSINVSNNKLIAYFHGADFTTGKWDMNVTIDPQSAPLLFAAAINIVLGEAADVWAQWIGPDRVLGRKPTTCYITYGNRGNKDAYGVFLYVAVSTNQTVLFPNEITHPIVDFEVNWDTIPNFVDVDYFLGAPFHGKVYAMFIPYMPQQYNGGMRLKVISDDGQHEIRVAISKPLYDNYEELYTSLKSTEGMAYNFFSCMYAVASLAADLTPGLGCAKAAFDNSVVMAIDKYQKGESIKAEDVVNSVAMTAIGCVPGAKQVGKLYTVAKGMASMSDGAGAIGACGAFAGNCFKSLSDMVAYTAHDPNAKYGPSGHGSSIFVPSDKEYQYMITYENDSAATAAAQRVIITDTLDKNVFNINSFMPIAFGFADTSYMYNPTDGDTIDIDLRPTKKVIVRVIYDLDESSGILTWTFLTLDPNTYELVESVDDGFLPPNRTAPEGEGNVLYSIKPISGLTEGTEIKNTAHIVFDWNAEIPTETWKNITDNVKPESAVEELSAVSLLSDFTVKWSGTDEGSGIFSYTIYVSENDTDYFPWILDTHDASAVFTGELGVTYKFYSVAVDSAGNKEESPVSYDAMTKVSGTGIDNFEDGNKMRFRVYPNPTSEILNVDCYLPESSNMKIDLLNSCGSLVAEQLESIGLQGNNKISIDVSGQPAGYYFVRILTKEGVQIRKVVIQ